MSINRTFGNLAYHTRLEAALDGVTAPNRASIRRELKHHAPRHVRRAVFGQWRRRWARDGSR